jgi:hypothetical protein
LGGEGEHVNKGVGGESLPHLVKNEDNVEECVDIIKAGGESLAHLVKNTDNVEEV